MSLQLAALTKVYEASGGKKVLAVDNLDITAEDGEIVALLGSSGCGKTSTLRMIAGFESVTKGNIRLKGKRIDNLAPSKRGVAMAFEGYSLYPPLTAEQNIAFALNSAGRAKAKKVVHEIAELLEVTDCLARYPSHLSGGQQQRISLARALVREADLHLLDEPMGQLEPQLRATLRSRVKARIKERGLTAILVTHDQAEANAMADRIAIMDGGRLQQYGTGIELRDRPANLYVATFFGEPPMNVFPVEVVQGGVQTSGRSTVIPVPRRSFRATPASSSSASGPARSRSEEDLTSARSSRTAGSATRRTSRFSLKVNRWWPPRRIARRSRSAKRCRSNSPTMRRTCSMRDRERRSQLFDGEAFAAKKAN